MSSIGWRWLVGLERPGSGASESLAGPTADEMVVLLIAGMAFIAGLIHVGAAVDHFGEFPLYTIVFALVAAVQLAWAASIVWRPSRAVLIGGCGFNVAIVGMWVASRTVGVPIAPQPWVPESVGAADLVATLDEILIVIAALALLMSARLPLAHRVVVRIAPVLLAALLLSVLYGVGGHAG